MTMRIHATLSSTTHNTKRSFIIEHVVTTLRMRARRDEDTKRGHLSTNVWEVFKAPEQKHGGQIEPWGGQESEEELEPPHLAEEYACCCPPCTTAMH